MAKTFSIKRIGNFLAYGIKNAYRFGHEENIHTIQSNLKSLMTVNGIDQLTLSILHGINTQSNLDLLEFDEVDRILELNIMKCYESLYIESDLFKEIFMDRNKKSEDVFVEPSPCMNVTNFPMCRVYCDWHQNSIASSSIDIGNVLRYFAVITRAGLISKLFDYDLL